MFKKMFYYVFFPVTVQYLFFKMVLKRLIATSKSIVTFPGAVKEAIAEAKQGVKPESFEDFRNKWNLETEEDLKNAAGGLVIQIGIWFVALVISVIFAAYAEKSLVVMFSLFAIWTVCGAGFLKASWQFDMIRRREFEIFTNWLKIWR